MFIVKYDSVGNILWLRGIGGHDLTNTNPTSIASDSTGNIYITGYCTDTIISFGTLILNKCPACSEVGMFLVKYDTGGNAIWARNAGGNGSVSGNKVAVSKANTVYFTGIGSDSLVLGSIIVTDTYAHSAFIAAYDTAGNALWAKVYGGTDTLYNIMAVDDSGNIILYGTTRSNQLHFGSVPLPITGAIGHQHLYFAKYDASGNLLWTKSAGSNEDDNILDITNDIYGNVYFLGSIMPDGNIIFGSSTFNAVGGFFGKYDAFGNFMWLMHAESTEVFEAITHDAGGYIYAAYAGGLPYLIFGSDSITIDTFPYLAFSIVKFDTSGRIIWNYESEYTHSGGGASITSINLSNFGSLYCTGEYFGDFLPTASGDYIDFGSIRLISPDSMAPIVYVAKLDTAYSLKADNRKPLGNKSILYPNPTINMLNIASQEIINNVVIFNMLGQMIYNCKFDKKQVRIDVSMLINGMYYVKINGTEELKFLKE